MPPDELDYAEPVDPLTSGAEQLDPMEDQGDSEPSPSDSGDSDDALPPPAEGEVDEMPADEAPRALPAEPAPPLPSDPASPPANEFDPSELPNEEEDEAADESANEPVNQFEGEAAPEAEAPPTSSRPRPLRAAQHPIVAAPQVAVSQPTVTIQVLEEGSMPPPLEEVVIEEAAPREFSTGAAAAQVTFGDSLEETSEFAAPKLRIGDSAAGSAAVSRPTITIVEVSAEANVKPVASAAAATSDSEFSAGAISVPAPKSSKTGAGKSTPAKGAPARHRLSDDADEAVRPVHWIDAALKASER